MPASFFEMSSNGDVPLLAAAVHDGHGLREEVAQSVALDEATRLREEDPFTGEWTAIPGNRVVATRSRFEVDLNRPRETAVYQRPDDAWGLHVWHAPPSPDLVERSLAGYDAFYAAVRELLVGLEERFGSFLVYDIHSYNHRRGGPDAPPDDPEANPEVNVGTGSMDRGWAPVVDAFIDEMRNFDYGGRHLDVRENVKFQGGNLPRWVHRTFPESGCALAIEFKKIFMDEWTGEPDRRQIELIRRALAQTVPRVLAALP